MQRAGPDTEGSSVSQNRLKRQRCFKSPTFFFFFGVHIWRGLVVFLAFYLSSLSERDSRRLCALASSHLSVCVSVLLPRGRGTFAAPRVWKWGNFQSVVFKVLQSRKLGFSHTHAHTAVPVIQVCSRQYWEVNCAAWYATVTKSLMCLVKHDRKCRPNCNLQPRPLGGRCVKFICDWLTSLTSAITRAFSFEGSYPTRAHQYPTSWMVIYKVRWVPRTCDQGKQW